MVYLKKIQFLWGILWSFKSLPVAPATLGLLAPMSANATEVNQMKSQPFDIETLEFANSFDNDDSIVNSLLAGGEGLVEDHSHDGVSLKQQLLHQCNSRWSWRHKSTETSTGLATDNDLDDSIDAGYDFGIALNTSFTGEDSLDIAIDAGTQLLSVNSMLTAQLETCWL